MQPTILVTGATGNVGGELVRILHRQGHDVCTAVLCCLMIVYSTIRRNGMCEEMTQ